MHAPEEDRFAFIMRGLGSASAFVLAFASTACKQPSDAPPAASAQPAVATPPPTASALPSPASPTPSAAALASASASSAAPSPASSDAGAAPEPAPAVKVTSIGMHVAGGPYDDATKQPFLRAVEPHYPELARCWKHVTKPKQGDAGVDLQIEAAGGKARVSNPRSTLVGEGFIPCVVAFFETIEFEKTNAGRRVVSYSVRFTPK